MRLKSVTLKGFKSFPDRTRLDFGPGVSVVVGPNGSGKSNVTDAVLWAMGEQSPLAVRGQTMQDVIFGGGRGVQARSAAEVEIVLENSDGTVDLPLSEISIVRHLDRAGEGGYRLNGARCRLTDVIEVLSDTGLGKETHSVISQGRVEAIVTSKARDRRLLIEEAAGLGKHRKRRRRAQLKLERTQENLDRALDVEREARTRLRPLKRQAEAAELHERLERQMLEARLELASDSLRARRAELGGAEERVKAARGERGEVESQLGMVVDRRGRAERALTERAERHDALARRLYDARSARERVGLRDEQVGTSAQVLARRIERLELELDAFSEARTAVAGLQSESAPPGAASEHDGESWAPADGSVLEPFWSQAWEEVRKVILDGVEHVLAQADERGRSIAASEVAREAERVARKALERALAEARVSGETLGGGPDAERPAGDGTARSPRIERLRAQHAADVAVAPLAERLGTALQSAANAVDTRVEQFERELAEDKGVGEEVAGELRACAGEEAEIQTRLRVAGDLVTEAEVAAQRLRDQAREAELELKGVAEGLGLAPSEVEQAKDAPDRSGAPQGGGLDEEQVRALLARVERLARRREQLGPVNPLAQEEYVQAVAHVEEMEGRRADLDTALRELRTVIRDTDRQIQETFKETFEAAARNFEELVGDVFPGGSGRLRLVSEEQAPRPVLGGQPLAKSQSGGPAVGGITADGDGHDGDAEAAEAGAEAEAEQGSGQEGRSRSAGREDWVRESSADGGDQGVEIEITPAGKSTKRLSLLSGGEKSLTALAFLFAVFLARPCPFYVLDEVEAALDDLNLDRFLALLRRYADRAQFIVITHQKRTMEAADWLYGVSMGGDGVSKVLSRSLPPEQAHAPEVAEVA
jgi:chromosome segregation ATPase